MHRLIIVYTNKCYHIPYTVLALTDKGPKETCFIWYMTTQNSICIGKYTETIDTELYAVGQ